MFVWFKECVWHELKGVSGLKSVCGLSSRVQVAQECAWHKLKCVRGTSLRVCVA